MESLPLPYEAHPAFRFGDAVERDLVAADVGVFVDTYARLEREAMSPVDREHAERTARASLGAIFADLARCEDAGFRAFAIELGEQCGRLLGVDLEHFAAQRRDSSRVVTRRDWLDALETQRFYFANVSPSALDELLAITRTPVEGLRANAARGRVSREDLSINGGPLALRVVQILDRDFERQGISDAVSAYARRRMRVTGVAVELSVANATWWRSHYEVSRPARTLYAHTDEGLANPKSIVYLSDVDEHTGPMSVYPGCEEGLGLTPLQKLVGRVINSVGTKPGSPLHALYAGATPRVFASPAFRRHFAMLPKPMRYNSHFGWDVIPDTSLERALVAAELPLVGPAGTLVVFDGARLIHRGGMVERGDRVALQVVFSSRSPLATAADRLVAAGHRANAARTTVSHNLRGLRQRVGATVQKYSPRPHARLIRDVSRILPPLACIDVGASYYPHPPWEVFRASSRTTWIAVEPNPQNTGYLDAWRWPSTPHRLGFGLSEHGGDQMLYVTNVDSGSSLLPPIINDDMAHRVPHHDYFFPLTEKRIVTKSLDELVADLRQPAVAPLFVKLDTQGTELSILRGAPRALAHQIVGIETEATLLANPVMVGSGKFSQVCSFLESHGFELLQMRPIEGGPNPPKSALARRTYLNECDAVFCLRRTELARPPTEHRIAALGFYLSYHLYAEARALLETIPGLEEICAQSSVDLARLRRLLDS